MSSIIDGKVPWHRSKSSASFLCSTSKMRTTPTNQCAAVTILQRLNPRRRLAGVVALQTHLPDASRSTSAFAFVLGFGAIRERLVSWCGTVKNWLLLNAGASEVNASSVMFDATNSDSIAGELRVQNQPHDASVSTRSDGAKSNINSLTGGDLTTIERKDLINLGRSDGVEIVEEIMEPVNTELICDFQNNAKRVTMDDLRDSANELSALLPTAIKKQDQGLLKLDTSLCEQVNEFLLKLEERIVLLVAQKNETKDVKNVTKDQFRQVLGRVMASVPPEKRRRPSVDYGGMNPDPLFDTLSLKHSDWRRMVLTSACKALRLR